MSIIRRLLADPNNHTSEVVGRGGFGIVMKITTGTDVYALKEIRIKDPSRLAIIRYEVEIMRKISMISTIDGYFPFPKIYDYQENPFSYKSSLALPIVYILMEYIDGFTLSDLIKLQEYKTMDIPSKIQLICQISIKILQAIDLLNQNSIIHRDLKNDNVLINYKNGQVKLTSIHLIDFGLSCMQTSDVFADPEIQSYHEKCPHLKAGTPNYMAPQLIDDAIRKQLTFKQLQSVDVWSFGVILYSMIYGKMPFSCIGKTYGERMHDLCSNIVNHKATNLSTILLNPTNEIEYTFSIIIEEILVDHQDRPTPLELITRFETILNPSK